jgi:hypothetical protein
VNPEKREIALTGGSFGYVHSQAVKRDLAEAKYTRQRLYVGKNDMAATQAEHRRAGLVMDIESAQTHRSGDAHQWA